MPSVERFFDGYPQSAAIHARVAAEIGKLAGVTTKVQKSQIGFSRAHPFAAVWIPEKQLKRAAAPLVLSVFARQRLASSRWKEVVEPAPGRFTHHLELHAADEVDAEVLRLVAAAHGQAG